MSNDSIQKSHQAVRLACLMGTALVVWVFTFQTCHLLCDALVDDIAFRYQTCLQIPDLQHWSPIELHASWVQQLLCGSSHSRLATFCAMYLWMFWSSITRLATLTPKRQLIALHQKYLQPLSLEISVDDLDLHLPLELWHHALWTCSHSEGQAGCLRQGHRCS